MAFRQNILFRLIAGIVPLFALFAFVLAYAWRFDFLQHIRPTGDLWWSDGHYELLRAFYVAHDLQLFKDVPGNHLPGLSLALSLLMKVTGFSARTPSPELLQAAERIGIAAAGFFQITLWYFAARVANLSRAAAVAVAIAATAFFWEGYGHFMPLAETVMIPALALAVLLLYRVLFGAPVEQCASAFKLGVLLVFCCLVTLAVVPAFAVFGAIAMIVLLWNLASDARNAGVALRQPSVIAAIGTLALFLAYLIATTDLPGLYYWNVTFNREVEQVAVGQNVLTHLSAFFDSLIELAPLRSAVGTNYPFFAYPPFFSAILVLAIAKLGLLHWRGGAGSLFRVVIFCLACFAAYIALGWRVHGQFVWLKFLFGVGIPAGLLFILCVPSRILLSDDRGQDADSWLAPIGIAIAVGLAILPLRYFMEIPMDASPRPEALSQAGVCSLSAPKADVQAGRCLCAVEAFYDPRTLLRYDARPCSGYSPDTPHNINHSKRESERFRDLAFSPEKGAFIVGLDEQASVMFDIPPEVYQAIVTRRTCRPLDPIFRICGR